jgi:intraflagellar transport protein 80
MLFLLQEIPLHVVQLAEMALLGGNVQDAESILLQNGLVFRAIVTDLQLHNWNR